MSDRRVSINDIKVPTEVVKFLSLERLKALQDEESSFNEFFGSLDLDDIKKVQTRRNELSSKNQELAAKSVDLEPRYEELRTELQKKAIEAAELKAEYQQRFEELKQLSSKADTSSVLKELQKSAKDTEQSSEELADKFVVGQLEMPVDQWLESVIRQRQLYWLRKVKAEKMEELVKQKQPRPMPRSPRVPRAGPETSMPPYLAPLPQQNPTHSLPAHMQPQPPYPTDTRGALNPSPAASLPPYQPPQMSMPQPSMPPGHPFPHAAFTPYQPRSPGQYPRQPPPRPAPYASMPPRPSPYSSMPPRPPAGGQQAYHSYR